MFLWHLGVTTLLRVDIVTQIPTTDSVAHAQIYFDRSLDTTSTLVLKNREKLVAVRESLLTTHFGFSSPACLVGRKAGLYFGFDSSQRLGFYTGFGVYPTHTLSSEGVYPHATETIVAGGSSVDVAVSTFLNSAHLIPTHPVLDTH